VYSLTGAVEHVAQQLPAPPRTVVLAGSGEFLANLVLREQKDFAVPAVISLAENLGPTISEVACAYALTQLVTID
jgi:hypothetical protein